MGWRGEHGPAMRFLDHIRRNDDSESVQETALELACIACEQGCWDAVPDWLRWLNPRIFYPDIASRFELLGKILSHLALKRLRLQRATEWIEWLGGGEALGPCTWILFYMRRYEEVFPLLQYIPDNRTRDAFYLSKFALQLAWDDKPDLALRFANLISSEEEKEGPFESILGRRIGLGETQKAIQMVREAPFLAESTFIMRQLIEAAREEELENLFFLLYDDLRHLSDHTRNELHQHFMARILKKTSDWMAWTARCVPYELQHAENLGFLLEGLRLNVGGDYPEWEVRIGQIVEVEG